MSNLLPPPYDSLPDDLQETLTRSHVQFEKGWKGISLADYLQIQSDEGNLDVFRAVYDRCLIYPAIWKHIEYFIGGWTYVKGHNISQGFNFASSNPDALLKLMRTPLAPFCEDLFNVHGPRDSFRELIKSGPGLHVCVTQPLARGTNPHDIHIDKFQTVCQKLPTGQCNYIVANGQAAENMKEHMREVIPWMAADARRKVEEEAKKKIELFKKFKDYM